MRNKIHFASKITLEEINNEKKVYIHCEERCYTRDLFTARSKECFKFNGGIYECEIKDNEVTKINFLNLYIQGTFNSLILKCAETETETETLPQIEQIELTNWNKSVKHEKYDQIEKCIANNIPVYLAGPAGSGKNYVLEQIAGELEMNFYFSNSIQQEYKLTGFIDASGKYHETEFYKAAVCEDDCIFFLDEIDASTPEVLVLLNAAIANGYFEFPNGKLEINHIHFVAAGNTVGSGADDKYTGRMMIDQATLDRFAIIHFDYDKNIEMHITKGNVELVNFIRALREEANKGMIRATFSYRCLSMVTKLEKTGMDLKDIIMIAVVKGLDKDSINTLNSVDCNKYAVALKEIQRVA